MNRRPRIAVVDHGAGNLVSISQALTRVGADPSVVQTPTDLRGSEAIVLPGVGSTAAVMEGIRSSGFEAPLKDSALPLLGICVGMQVLFEGSDEDGATCLGLIPGVVRPLDNAPLLPHIGWNTVTPTRPDPLVTGADETYYFVHSFAPVPEDAYTRLATTEYGSAFASMIRSGRLAGTQFHPERSGGNGLALLGRFVQQVVLDAA